MNSGGTAGVSHTPFAERKKGDPFAQYYLGVIYRYGRGVPQDYVQAHMWFNLASASPGQPLRYVAEYLDSVEKKMTPAQIAEAQKLAREWKPTTQSR